MTDNEKKNLLGDDQTNKTELANRIARQSRKMANTYQQLEDVVFRTVRWFSALIDKALFNRKYGKITALVLAVLLYVAINYNTMASIYTNSMKYTRTIPGAPVTARYNTDTFELSGMPDKVDIQIIGDATNVTNALTSGGVIVADLEGLTEGSHQVKFTGEGFGDNVSVVVDPSVTVVTLKKKTTQQFDLSWDFINLDSMANIYSVGTPQFEYTKVNVRASKDTLSSIAFVKALIDVSGQMAEFEQDARLIAYDASGYPVQADIVPDRIHVKVPVTSPNKTVPIEIQVSGEVPDGMAIDSITADQQTVTIYGSESVLGEIDKVMVTLSAATITKDSTLLRPIVLPAGVNSSNINQITINVTIAESVTRVIENVPINFRNNINNYKASQPENKTTTSITVTGTQTNVDRISAANINVYVDMKDAVPGLQDFRLYVDQPSDGLVKYILNEASYTLNVLGETTDTDSSGNQNTNND